MIDDMGKSYSVSKLEAARRQLDTAIRLYMAEKDELSIHTLTCAAHTLLDDLLKKQNKTGFFSGYFKERIKPEKWNEVFKKMNEAKNFFKHADLDPEAKIVFKPESTELWLWDACNMYNVVGGELTDYMHAYFTWFPIMHPGIVADKEMSGRFEQARTVFKTRQDFMANFLLALSHNNKLL